MSAPTSVPRRRSLVVATAAVVPAAVLVTAALAPDLTAATGTGPAPQAPQQGPQESEQRQQGGDPNTTERAKDVVFAIHGGAGTILREDLTPGLERRYRRALTRSVRDGYRIIRRGGDSTDAVEAAINRMEDSPLFNAGKGAVFTTDAAHELDSSIMDGETLDAGAVTGVQHIRNPISLALELMEQSDHVLLAGEGAELFAQHRGIDLVTQDYFFTQRRWDSLIEAKGGDTDFEFGETNTVGAVGMDRDGNLAAGTSTGGLTNKPVGRIGDSPIVGAGTYANNETAAVSATGTGELFIRQAVAHEISSVLEYTDRRLAGAAGVAIDKTEEIGGPDTGGVIALDGRRNLAFVFNTAGMYRAYVTEDGEVVVRIFDNE